MGSEPLVAWKRAKCRCCGVHESISGAALCIPCVEARISGQEKAVEEQRSSTAYATQEYVVRKVLSCHSLDLLTIENIDRIVAELVWEMREGSSSWAFEPPPQEEE